MISRADKLTACRKKNDIAWEYFITINLARVYERMKWLNGSNLNKSFLLTGLWIGYHVDCIHITTLQGAVPRLYTSFGFGSKRAIVNSLNFFSWPAKFSRFPILWTEHVLIHDFERGKLLCKFNCGMKSFLKKAHIHEWLFFYYYFFFLKLKKADTNVNL